MDALLSRAIELDPNFAIAYANRAGFADARFAFNYETSDEVLQRIRSDLAMAKRLAPRDAIVLAAEGGHFAWVERDLPRSLAAFQAAADAGLADSMFLCAFSVVLQRLGRYAEAIAFTSRAMALDPANPFVLAHSSLSLASLLQVGEALKWPIALSRCIPTAHFPGWFARRSSSTARGGRRNCGVSLRAQPGTCRRATSLDLNFLVLMKQGAYDELQVLLDAIPESEVRCVPGPGGGGPLFGVGKRPLAQFRGWLALARGNVADAARYGAEVLAFVERQKTGVQNAWFLHLLSADGHLLQGHREDAIAAARAAVEAIAHVAGSLRRLCRRVCGPRSRLVRRHR